jgi:hypothetical protein
MQPHRPDCGTNLLGTSFRILVLQFLGMCGSRSVGGGPIGGNPPATKRLTSPYLPKWEKSNVDNDEQQLPVHRKQGLWRG